MDWDVLFSADPLLPWGMGRRDQGEVAEVLVLARDRAETCLESLQEYDAGGQSKGGGKWDEGDIRLKSGSV